MTMKLAAILFCFVHGGGMIGMACVIAYQYRKPSIVRHVAAELLAHAALVFLALSGFYLYWDVMPVWRIWLAIAAFVLADYGLVSIVLYKLKERKVVSK